MKKYVVEFYDYENGATSTIDKLEAPEGYTAEDYIRGCQTNADDEWNEMLAHGEVYIVPVED